jgi:superfamily II RNA helicase
MNTQQYFEILTEDTVKNINMPENPAMNFNFECDKFQLLAFNAIEQGNHILVTAPTSSGKTLCAEYAIAYHNKHYNRIIYTSPIKSLSNEKYKDFKDNKPDLSIGLLTGDNKINPDADLLIVTAEILRNALYQDTKIDNKLLENQTKTLLQDVKCVIMDEVHFINDLDRGKIWEETIILLDDSIQLILLSATINKVNEFANWIGSIKKKKLSLIPTNRRIIPLEHYFYVDNELHKILDNQDTFDDKVFFESKKIYDKIKKDNKYKIDYQEINRLIKYLQEKNLLQAIFFSFSRKKCEDFTKQIQGSLLDVEDQREVLRVFDYHMRPYIKIYETTPQYIDIRRLLEKGVCYHHSGLIPIFKEIIEIIFKLGLVKIIFATETFAVGVNMPTRTIVFTELIKTTNINKRFLNTAEYKQMSGRAGRRGKDKKGTVIILPLYDFPDLQDLKNVMVKTMPHIDSKFTIDYDYCLKSLKSNKTDTYDIFNKSLLNCEHSNNLKQYQNELPTQENIIQTHEFNNYKDKLDDCIKLDKLINQNISSSFNIKLSQKDKKIIQQLKNNISENILKLYQDYKKQEDKLKDINNNINFIINYIQEATELFNIILQDNKYIIKEDNKCILTTKGICAANINECNGIIVTEIIFSGLLDNLTTHEIIALMSIFLNPPRTQEDYNYNSYNLIKEYKEVKKIIEKINEEENRFNILLPEYWYVDDSYIDIILMWCHNKPLKDILKYLYEMGEYEGNFVRNMLKLNNIINNIITVATVINNIKLVDKLKDASNLILKDIVNTNSLYIK